MLELWVNCGCPYAVLDVKAKVIFVSGTVLAVRRWPIAFDVKQPFQIRPLSLVTAARQLVLNIFSATKANVSLDFGKNR